MSCTTSAAWMRLISSPYYTEHGQRCGAVLSGHITIVAMSKSDQLSLRCTVESNCSGMLDISLFMWSTVRWGRGVRGSTGALISGRRGWGHVAAPEPTPTWR
jgi:hypothetical protein